MNFDEFIRGANLFPINYMFFLDDILMSWTCAAMQALLDFDYYFGIWNWVHLHTIYTNSLTQLNASFTPVICSWGALRTE